MNIINLLKIANYSKDILPIVFDMGMCRKMETVVTPVCTTVGCILGHCTILDAANVIKNHMTGGEIDYLGWAEDFTGLQTTSREFQWLFSARWVRVDNTPTGAARRIKNFVAYGVPNNMEAIMAGKAPINY